MLPAEGTTSRVGTKSRDAHAFIEGAQVVVDFATETIGVHRLEHEAVVQSGGQRSARVNNADGPRRRSFEENGTDEDQGLWSSDAPEWRQAKAVWGPKVH